MTDRPELPVGGSRGAPLVWALLVACCLVIWYVALRALGLAPGGG